MGSRPSLVRLQISWADSSSRLHTYDSLSLSWPQALAPQADRLTQMDRALTPRGRQIS